jgi:hypothetical protein
VIQRRPLSLSAALVAGLLLASPAQADAQGNGNGRPKSPKGGAAPTTSAPTTSTPTSSPSPTAPATSASPAAPAAVEAPPPDIAGSVVTFRQFGSWLDDASASFTGEGYVSIGVGYWRLPGMSQVNIPMLGAGVGVTDRMQVSASVPFYNVRYDGGSARGVDDIYLGAKYTLIDPALTISEFGLAVAPVVEVLSAGTPGGRVHFAIPVSMELRRAPFRVYGSAGYFTRGSVFTGGALEWTAPSRLMITGALVQSYSVKDDPVLDSWLVGRQRVDVMASGAYPIGSMAAAYASVGRSLSSPDGGATSLALSGGVSLRFAR